VAANGIKFCIKHTMMLIYFPALGCYGLSVTYLEFFFVANFPFFGKDMSTLWYSSLM